MDNVHNILHTKINVVKCTMTLHECFHLTLSSLGPKLITKEKTGRKQLQSGQGMFHKSKNELLVLLFVT